MEDNNDWECDPRKDDCGGISYPGQNIDKFIEDNKALLRRMYGVMQEVTLPSRTLEESTRYISITTFPLYVYPKHHPISPVSFNS